MTNKQFKNSVNSELKRLGFDNKIRFIEEQEFTLRTVLIMTKPVSEEEKRFFNQRFTLSAKIWGGIKYLDNGLTVIL